uniref:Uncharacterized protein n=1 Tax=Lotharella oceanica TaxID=641309 RepID=A0A7S2U0H3_9EUKA
MWLVRSAIDVAKRANLIPRRVLLTIYACHLRISTLIRWVLRHTPYGANRRLETPPALDPPTTTTLHRHQHHHYHRQPPPHHHLLRGSDPRPTGQRTPLSPLSTVAISSSLLPGRMLADPYAPHDERGYGDDDDDCKYPSGAAAGDGGQPFVASLRLDDGEEEEDAQDKDQDEDDGGSGDGNDDDNDNEGNESDQKGHAPQVDDVTAGSEGASRSPVEVTEEMREEVRHNLRLLEVATCITAFGAAAVVGLEGIFVKSEGTEPADLWELGMMLSHSSAIPALITLVLGFWIASNSLFPRRR